MERVNGPLFESGNPCEAEVLDERGDELPAAGALGGRGRQQTDASDLEPTKIKSDNWSPQVGDNIHFDSGVRNNGKKDTPVFNVKWFVDGQEVGLLRPGRHAYGSHAGVPGGATVLDGNSQFEWDFDTPGRHSVTFSVDVDNHVAESNEKNNFRSVRVTVG